jgi:hypothetical protein
LNDVEAVVDASGVGVRPEFRMPVGLDWYALEECTEEDSDGVHDVEDHESPNDPVNSGVVTSEAEQEDEDRGLDKCQYRVVAELLEEIPPEAC